MRRFAGVSLALAALWVCGCAKICEFGEGSSGSGLKCLQVTSRVSAGMTSAEVEDRIGPPQSKKFDMPYRGKTYEEVWVYETSTPTVLYFNNGVLEHKEYEQ
jgi:hypothetical protein